MSHVSFSAATGSHVNVGQTAGVTMPEIGEPHHWWRALWSRRDGRVAEIRRLMQAQIAALPDPARHAALVERIVEADHPEVLWTLRDALTQALVQAHGEALARRRMTDITFMFAGLLDRERHAPASPSEATGVTDWASGSPARGLVRSVEQAHSDH